jgi:selenide,water dikinase
MMNDAADESHVATAIEQMARLNYEASRAAVANDANAITDITGFGLIGHLHEMACGSGTGATIFADKLPLLPGALELASSGSFYSGGERRNRKHIETDLHFSDSVPENLQRITADPQTSGGLLIAIGKDSVQTLLAELEENNEKGFVIGELNNNPVGKIEIVMSNT